MWRWDDEVQRSSNFYVVHAVYTFTCWKYRGTRRIYVNNAYHHVHILLSIDSWRNDPSDVNVISKIWLWQMTEATRYWWLTVNCRYAPKLVDDWYRYSAKLWRVVAFVFHNQLWMAKLIKNEFLNSTVRLSLNSKQSGFSKTDNLIITRRKDISHLATTKYQNPFMLCFYIL